MGEPSSGTAEGLKQYSAKDAADISAAALAQDAENENAVAEAMSIAYSGDHRPSDVIGYMAGNPIPEDPGEPVPGEKRRLPPPPGPAEGGASPEWKGS